jgi:hypothetical protein
MSLDQDLRILIREEIATALREELREVVGKLKRGEPANEVQLVDIKTAAKAASVCTATIRSWIRTGRLRALGHGRVKRIRLVDVTAALQESQTPAAPERTPDEQALAIMNRRRR